MSSRRKTGDWVWLAPGSGFVGESHRLRVQIGERDEDMMPCCCIGGDCGDPDCVEWPDLLTEADPQQGGVRHPLCHVTECRMFDEQQILAARPAEFDDNAAWIRALSVGGYGVDEIVASTGLARQHVVWHMRSQ